MSNSTEFAHPEPVPADFPQVGTVEWGQMNRRRAELIRKEIAGTLTEEERVEYAQLQRWSLARLEAAFPHQATGGIEGNGA
jgi:hypothetical protein